MANITRIKAEGDSAKKESKESAKSSKTPKTTKPATPPKKTKSSEKTTFVLFRPFVAFGCYLRDSWREIRQVRWPSRKATWKMFFAVLIYALLFVVIIVLLDLFFTWLFNLILGNK